jgi:AMMECR1 domain-containing protein
MFRRTLFDPRLANWEALLQHLANIQLTPGKDIFQWNLHESGKFLMASMFNALILPDVPAMTIRKFGR